MSAGRGVSLSVEKVTKAIQGVALKTHDVCKYSGFAKQNRGDATRERIFEALSRRRVRAPKNPQSLSLRGGSSMQVGFVARRHNSGTLRVKKVQAEVCSDF